MDKEIEIKGIISEIIFYNEENGYLVAVFETPSEQFVAVGNMVNPIEGREYLIKGDFIEHNKYGEQFSFKSYEELMPTSVAGIEGFLASKVLKGIGPKMARAIVEKFGENSLKVIENEPKRLLEVSGIGEKKAQTIVDSFKNHMEFANITIFLQQYDIKADMALKIYNVYGKDTIEAITSNPYHLIDDVNGISFVKADKIAENVGIKHDDENRIRSGIKYILNKYASSGNSFAPRMELLEETGQTLELPMDQIDDELILMAFEGDVQIENLQGQEVVFLMAYYVAEQSVTKKIRSLHDSKLRNLSLDIDNLIKQTEKQHEIVFSEEQQHAMKTCINNGISVITGGPGTGKTTIINGILNILEWSEFSTAIAAPTGRAAKRIMETTGRDAMTIHRLLEYYFSGEEKVMKFGKNKENQLEYDAIIIDEASMVDLLLMDALLKAIPDGTRLILVGDADQLPSVGVGNVLGDILDCEYIYSVRLTKIFRQAQESMIVVNAHRINKGEYPYCNEKDKDFFFMQRNSEKQMLETILKLCSDRLPNYYHLKDRIQEIQVITPTRKGMLGSINLNNRLQEVLNPPSDYAIEKEFGGRIFRQYDKVMQIRNNYEISWKKASDFSDGAGVFNGEIGFISNIDKEHNKVTVIFDGDKYVNYDFQNLDELELAYAMTVHKSQGSEFPVVVMPMTWVPPMLANRNLLYTGVTRGKTAVVLVGSQNSMMGMIDNNMTRKRNSGLAIRMKNIFEKLG